MSISPEEYRVLAEGMHTNESRKTRKAAKAPIPKENAILSACIKWLHMHGCDVIRMNTGAYKSVTGAYVRYGKKGAGDIVACSPTGQWVEIETKRKGKKQEPHQVRRQEEIERLGGIYILAYSIDDLEANKGRIVGKSNGFQEGVF